MLREGAHLQFSDSADALCYLLVLITNRERSLRPPADQVMPIAITEFVIAEQHRLYLLLIRLEIKLPKEPISSHLVERLHYHALAAQVRQLVHSVGIFVEFAHTLLRETRHSLCLRLDNSLRNGVITRPLEHALERR